MANNIVLMDRNGEKPLALPALTFAELGVRERQDLEAWITKNPDILGTKLLIISREYQDFDKSNKRLDLLAIDKDKKLVVIELKLDAAKSLADLQAIRYAAFCSSMTFPKVVSLYAAFAGTDEAMAKRAIQDFVDDPEFSSLDNKPRIILAAGGFDDQELTSCVLWLRTFSVEISCVEITPYRIPENNRLILVPRVIIPLPEAEDFIVRAEKKEAERTVLSPAQLTYLERNQQICEVFRTLRPDKAPVTPPPRQYFQISTGRGGVHFEWGYMGRGDDKWLHVALHFETNSAERNRELCTYFEQRKADLEAEVGEPLMFDPDRGNAGWTAMDLCKKCEPWSADIARWAAEAMDRLIGACQPLLDKFYAEVPSAR